MKYVIAIFGVSGVGKTYTQKYLKDAFNAQPIITHTTRAPREHEKNGVDYYFDSKKSFHNLDLMESTEFDNNFYGSAMDDLKRGWKHHDLLSIVLDYKGVASYINRIPKNIIPIYLFSNEDKVIERLKHRGTSPQDIKNRLDEHQKNLNNIYRILFHAPIHVYKIDATNNKLKNHALDKLIESYSAKHHN